MPLPSQLPDDFISKVNNHTTLIGNRYTIVKRIGSGNFGTAFLIDDSDASNENEKKKVLKQICVGPLDPGETVDAMQEAKLLSQLTHKNIVQFHQSFMDGQFFCIVLEYCEGGDLECTIKAFQKKNDYIPEEQVVRWLKQLLRAISYMHGRRILHRDLKSRNIFLKDNQIKIGDFGISRILIGTADKASTFVGTPYYMSPEVLNHEEYDEKCDIWSLGCVLYEICCFEHAFSGTSLMDVMMKIVSQHAPQLPDLYSRGLNIILQRMLDRDVNKRQTARQILSHPVLKKTDTLPKNSQKLLSARDRLRMKKQKEADAKMQRLKEIAKEKHAENERIRRESQERNFSRSSFDINMEIHEQVSPTQIHRLATINDEELLGSVVFQPVDEDTIKAPQVFGIDDDDFSNPTLTEMVSTEELIRTLIQDGDIPEDSDLADTFYSLHDDFESSSSDDEDLPDDRVEMSDSEYRDMIGAMQDALHLNSSVMSKRSVMPGASHMVSDVGVSSRNFAASSPRSSAPSLPAKNRTIAAFSRNLPRPVVEERPLTAVPPTERPLSHFASNMMEQRISNMRLRCKEALGEELFSKAYLIAKDFSFDVTSHNTIKAENLKELVGDSNKLMELEQLVYLEKEAAAEMI